MADVATYVPYHWMILGGLFLGALIAVWRIVAYYSDPSSRYFIATLVINITILCAVSSILIIPVDIFTTANDLHVLQIEHLYTMMYIGLAVSVILMSPFAYFYVEEADNGEEECMIKTCTAFRGTLFVVFILAIILGGILVIGERETSHVSTKEAVQAWITGLVSDHERNARAHQALLHVMAACTAVGFVNLVMYGGFGLASLPVVLIRGNLGAEEEKLEIEFSRLKLRQEKQKLEKRGKSKRARQAIDQIEHKIKMAEKRMDNLEKQVSEIGCYSYVYTILAPFRVGIGLGLMVLSMLVIGTAGVTCIDRFFNSSCGFSCGYLVEANDMYFPNVIDILMVKLSEYFPLDYIVFAAMALYLFVASAHGVGRMGVRLMGIQVFKIKRRRTSAQALLLSAAVLAILALAISVTLLSIAPQYVSFGAQSYTPKGEKEAVPCEMGSAFGEQASCRLTSFAKFVGSQIVDNRLFSLAFFYGQGAFVAVALVSLLHAFCRRRDGSYAGDDLSDSDSDDCGRGMDAIGEELRMLTERD
mmetsp:Transcript_13050/g.23679  ORF Transcript_13050/g.23679 Transcript_13050/m.23679 type:complete len:531 (-) Transcript_13050:109-1701(-)|eukprot:CAMPEP_0197524696 /NCGR_PEP_ID=MMETSP1318-20131121/9288_1 /TAXON_ID=552666 /ORGANISM="Partenskyella glossopodia, Strain RCC365" /LENGTH=530 /DNA_ID=CAMNT_0043077691 /DNA_START=139 /DNA_END=1731 /DNA_ORIENTATION=-